LSVYSQAHLNKIALRLNQRPRETLGFQTPASKLQDSATTTELAEKAQNFELTHHPKFPETGLPAMPKPTLPKS
jgi:hypothetical protein